MRARLFPELANTGGVVKTTPEDFIVEEQPAYLPSGEGTHTFVFVEKRGLTTEELIHALCKTTGVPRETVGAAGMKDRQAVSRQWLSLPDVDPVAASALRGEKWHVLSAARHGNKLRTGHLRGNRFILTLRGLRCPPDEAVVRATAILDALRGTGLPNFFGAQRFGARGDNAPRGRALVKGEALPRSSERIGRGEKRLLVSAFQSELFNAYLDARLGDRLLRALVPGDVLRKRDSGGLFSPTTAEEADASQRLSDGALDVTGPMFGSAMRSPTTGSPSFAREEAVLTAAGVTAEDFGRMGPLGEGTRRPLTVPIEDVELAVGTEPATLRLAFSLPSGAYATVLVEELTRP
ncbi:MAG: tRNA pseudouridine(13) synthase TruD [Polyangia bacterium]